MTYALNLGPTQDRFFSSKRLYSDVDWTSLDQIVDAYRQRVLDWYADPAYSLAANIHFAFAVMALNCLLIDTLSQFVSGSLSSNRELFMRFVRNHLPADYSAALAVAIPRDPKPPLARVDEVLYYGFRCGILHEAHIPIYGAVVPGGPRVQVVPPDGSVTLNGADCPVVIVNPLALREDVRTFLEHYLGLLKDRGTAHDQLRANFKTKFSAAFGIDITSAS